MYTIYMTNSNTISPSSVRNRLNVIKYIMLLKMKNKFRQTIKTQCCVCHINLPKSNEIGFCYANVENISHTMINLMLKRTTMNTQKNSNLASHVVFIQFDLAMIQIINQCQKFSFQLWLWHVPVQCNLLP